MISRALGQEIDRTILIFLAYWPQGLNTSDICVEVRQAFPEAYAASASGPPIKSRLEGLARKGLLHRSAGGHGVPVIWTVSK